MSLCLLVQTRDQIIVAGDTRESIRVNGALRATGTYIQKIRRIGDRIIFSTGNSYVAKSVLDEYQTSGNLTIDNLVAIKERHVKQYAAQHGARYAEERGHALALKDILSLIVCFVKDGISHVYNISSETPEIQKFIGESLTISDGSRSNEALKLYKSYRGTSVREAFRSVYNTLADEGIGGDLTIFAIDRKEIVEMRMPIYDSRPIDIAPQEVLWTREHGLIIERSDHASRVTMNSDEMMWEINGEKKLHYDAFANRLMFGGTLEAADGIFSGALQAASGTFTGVLEGGSFIGGDIVIGTGNDVFKADSSGIWAGHNSFGSAPFSVDMQGHLYAFNAEIQGDITASTIHGGTIDGTTITGANIFSPYIASSVSDFPRVEFSSDANLIRAMTDAQHTLDIFNWATPDMPAIRFSDFSANRFAYMWIETLSSEFIISTVNAGIQFSASGGDVRIAGNNVILNNVNVVSELSNKATKSSYTGTLYVSSTSGGPANRAISVVNGVIQ